MRIKRSAIIIYSSSAKKRGMRNGKLINYKNERYLEMMREIVNQYEDVVTVDINNDYGCSLSRYKELEEIIIKCIYSELKKAKNNKVLVISSDMPLIKKELVNYMGKVKFDEDILIPYANNKFQKLCAIYDKKVLKSMEYIIENDEVSFSNLFENISVRYIFPKDNSMFICVDELEKYITYYI